VISHHAINNTKVEMEGDMSVQAGVEVVDESDCTNVKSRLVRTQCTGAVSLQALRNGAQYISRHQFHCCPIALQKKAQSLWHR
jgi:hypothetical protein